MGLTFTLKHRFFSAFRELFVHHHGSLAFRSKLFALVISADSESTLESFMVVKKEALKIYSNDESRANLLVTYTMELVNKIHNGNGLSIDSLVDSIVRELKFAPRYAKKIDIESLKQLLELTNNEDILTYQKNILEFLQNIKDETLNTKKNQIESDEKKLSVEKN
ncbi:MAG: hypothetical protein JXQ66_05110 [Campylobacterales bacterium]|nr:hypothetical protein [Campylobacterales bacterium]